MNKQMEYPLASRGYLLIALAGISWGTTGTIANSLMRMGVESQDVSFLRMFCGFMFLLAFMLIKDHRSLIIDGKGLLISFVLGVFGHLGFNYAYFYSVDQIGVAAATVLLYTAPLFLLFLSRVLFKEKLSRIKILGVIICICGSYLAICGSGSAWELIPAAGISLGILSAIIYAFISIVSKVAVRDYKPDAIILYSFLFGALGSMIISPPNHLVSYLSNAEFLIAAAGIGTFSSSVAYVLYFKGIETGVELSKAGVISVLELVVSFILSVVIIGEPVDGIKISGILLIVTAIVIIQSSDRTSGKTVCESQRA